MPRQIPQRCSVQGLRACWTDLKDMVVFDNSPYANVDQKVLCTMFLNMTPKSCMRSWTRMGETEAFQVGLGGLHRGPLHQHHAQGQQHHCALHFLSPLIVAFYLPGQKAKHSYKVYCPLASVKGHFLVTVELMHHGSWASQPLWDECRSVFG